MNISQCSNMSLRRRPNYFKLLRLEMEQKLSNIVSVIFNHHLLVVSEALLTSSKGSPSFLLQ